MIAAVDSISWWASLALAGVGSVAGLFGLWLLALAIAAISYRVTPAAPSGSTRLSVLVPAHDESDLIGRCLKSIAAQDYPAAVTSVVVVADNCRDDTARIAERYGASVLVRHDPERPGKGHALRFALDRLMAVDAPDAFVVVDADSVAEPGLLSGLVAMFERGHPAVQAEYLVEDDPSPRIRLRAAAFLLFHRARFAGRAVLGLPCSLVGNGMLLSTALLRSCPWNATTGAEDLEYSVHLRMAGFRPVFTAAGRVYAPVPGSAKAAQVQRERWEGGRLHVARLLLPAVARRAVFGRRAGLLELAVDLATPPLGFLALASAGGAASAVALWSIGLLAGWVAVPWLVAVVAVAGHVLVGLRAAGAPRQVYADLLSAPRFLVEKIAGLPGVLRSRPDEEWVRTERPSEHAA